MLSQLIGQQFCNVTDGSGSMLNTRTIGLFQSIESFFFDHLGVKWSGWSQKAAESPFGVSSHCYFSRAFPIDFNV